MRAGHDHPGDPEEQDVVARDQDGAGVERPEVWGVVGPPQRGEGPQPRAEPGVEDVLVLDVAGPGAVDRDHERVLVALAVVADRVPHGDPVAPPQLAADGPVADVAEPAAVLVGPPGRVERDGPVVDDRQRLVGQRLHRDVPLGRQERLDDGLRPRRDRRGDRVVLGLDQLAGRVEVGDDLALGLGPVEPGVGAGQLVQRPVGVHDRQRRQVVALADLPVDLAVAGRHLEGAGAEVLLDRLVGDDGDGPAGRRDEHVPADEVPEPVVVGVDGDGRVGGDRLGPRRRDVDVAAGLPPLAVDDGVADGPQVPRPLDVVDLLVRDDGLVVGVPVDEVLAAVDEPLLVQRHEHLLDGPAQPLVHGEPAVPPVGRVAQAPLLLQDDVAVLTAPGPDVLQERVAPDRLAVDAVLLELLLDDVLGRDAGVVEPGDPQGLEPPHPLVPDEQVLDRVLERVAHVEPAGHVGRRHRDHERLLFAGQHRVRVGVEKAAVLPVAVPRRLDGLGLVRRAGGGGRRRRRGLGGAGPVGGRLGRARLGRAHGLRPPPARAGSAGLWVRPRS